MQKKKKRVGGWVVGSVGIKVSFVPFYFSPSTNLKKGLRRHKRFIIIGNFLS